MEDEDIKRTRELLELLNQRKHELDKQAAIFGFSTEPSITLERQSLARKIGELQELVKSNAHVISPEDFLNLTNVMLVTFERIRISMELVIQSIDNITEAIEISIDKNQNTKNIRQTKHSRGIQIVIWAIIAVIFALAVLVITRLT